MQAKDANTKVVSKLIFRLLPIQILLAAVGSINGIVSSYFASNYIGISAMSVVGLFTPINMLLGASTAMLAGGATILCGKYLGRNEQDRVQNIFSLNLLISLILAGVFSLLLFVLGFFDLTGVFTRDEAVRPLFNRYLLGQVIGIVPLVLGNQLPNYLTMENKDKRAISASVVYIAVNVVLNLVFIQLLHMDILALRRHPRWDYGCSSVCRLRCFFPAKRACAFRREYAIGRMVYSWSGSAFPERPAMRMSLSGA